MKLLDLLNGAGAATGSVHGAASDAGSETAASIGDAFEALIAQALRSPANDDDAAGATSGDDALDDTDNTDNLPERAPDDLSLLIAMAGGVVLPAYVQAPVPPPPPPTPGLGDTAAPPEGAARNVGAATIAVPGAVPGTGPQHTQHAIAVPSSTAPDLVLATAVHEEQTTATGNHLAAAGTAIEPSAASVAAPISAPTAASIAPPTHAAATHDGATYGRRAGAPASNVDVVRAAVAATGEATTEGAAPADAAFDASSLVGQVLPTEATSTARTPGTSAAARPVVPANQLASHGVPANPVVDAAAGSASGPATVVSASQAAADVAAQSPTEQQGPTAQQGVTPLHARVQEPGRPHEKATEGTFSIDSSAANVGGAVTDASRGGHGSWTGSGSGTQRDPSSDGASDGAVETASSQPKAVPAVVGAQHAQAPTSTGPVPADGVAPASPIFSAQDESNVQSIVRAVRMQWTSSGGEATLRLDPEHLGQVTLTVRVERGTVTAHIQAETAEAGRWIETHQHDLRTSLREQGLEVKDVVVTTNPDGRREQERQPQPRRPRPTRRDGNESIPTFEVVA